MEPRAVPSHPISALAPLAANLGRRPAVDFGKDGVEPSQAPEARLHRDLCHRQAGLVEQAFSPLHPCRPCHFGRTSLEMTREQSRQLP